MTDTYIDIQLAANDEGFLTFDQALAYAEARGLGAEFLIEYAGAGRCLDGVDSCDFGIWLEG